MALDAAQGRHVEGVSTGTWVHPCLSSPPVTYIPGKVCAARLRRTEGTGSL
jgi:hypothetical protein